MTTASYSTVEQEQQFACLRDLKNYFGDNPNLNDRADALIAACIEDGIDTKSAIIGTLMRLGLDNRHVGLRIDKGAKTGVTLSLWTVGSDKRYRVRS